VHQHGMPEEERTYSLTGKAIRRKDVEALRQCPMCGGVAAPAPICGRCAYEFPAPAAPTVSEREIGRILRPNATLEDKQATYERLARTARERGYKPGWLAHRFRATYGHWPVGLRERTVAA
jgi:DNA repair protein RadD